MAADLVIADVSVSDGGPAVGAAFTLSVTVGNGGGVTAGATTLRYYQSRDATITTSDTPVGEDEVPALDRLGRASKSVDLPAPSTPGTYHYGACVDAVTGESNTANNCSSSVTVTVTALYPDLEVALTVNAATQYPGKTFSLSATVSNTGDGESQSTTLRYYQSTDATITTSDTSVGTDAVGTLAASGTSAESISLTVPSSLGTYYYGACVDTVPDESDTTNNCSAAVQVNVQAWKPDLLMSNLRVDLADPVTGETFTLSADVLNGTRAPSAATTLRYYRSADSTITTEDTEVGTDAVDALSAYGSSAESISLTAPATTGAYYYGACVDAVAGESDTTNNCSVSVKVDVVAAQGRVDISPRTLTFEAVGDSETVTVRVLDENGDEDTDASYFWISASGPGGPCCTLTKVDDGLKVTMTRAGTRAGRMQVDLSSDDAKSARLQVTAYQKATTLEISPNSVSLEVDETDTLSATIKDANGHAIEGLTVYWTTSDSDVATVEGADDGGETGATATVTAAATGTATITARHGPQSWGIKDTAAVTVTSSTEQ
ncbi:MAG: Ig-like domain-containing protein [Spirochaetaceae bacterium]|nr:Ig-like domain-containing protein [Spirochaetaceae bacterium]